MGETEISAGTGYRSGDQPLSVKIREAIAARTDTTADCEPLYNVIDPDALEALFASPHSDTDREGTVTFQYCGYHVTVTSNQTVELTPLDTEKT